MSEAEYMALFHAFRDFHESTRSDDPEWDSAFRASGEFFKRLRNPDYRMTLGERQNALIMLNRFIQRHPDASRDQLALHHKLSAPLE